MNNPIETPSTHVEILSTGLKCDTPTCDWKDETLAISDWPNWINVPCPKCGGNLLTQEDYDNVMTLMETVKFVNAHPKEVELMLALNSDAYAAAGIDPDEKVNVTFNTHKTITIDSIERLK